jgi:MFS family permease
MRISKKSSIVTELVPSPGARLWRNSDFNIFWVGQTLSVLGDAFASIAMPLLVLQATGSVALMGLVTATFSIGQIISGVFAGVIADRVDRRKLMICCDIGRALLYSLIPLVGLFFGAQLWLIFVVVGVGACLGMAFQVTYVAAVANLVDGDQIVDANSRLQITYAIAFVTGPVIAGFVIGSLGASVAIAFDAFSFLISATSLYLIRLRPVAQATPLELSKQEALEQTSISGQIKSHSVWDGLVAGIMFIWHNPMLRPVMFLLGCFTFAITGCLDLFIFHLKHDLGANDKVVGIVFGLASIGGIIGGVLAPTLRKRLGFGPCWLGSFFLNSISIILIAIAPNLIVCCLLAIVFTFTSTISGVVAMSLRQQITPDHLLGRVTAVYWTIIGVPGPIGAALFTNLSVRIGAPAVLEAVGTLCLGITMIGLFTAARRRFPERQSII